MENTLFKKYYYGFVLLFCLATCDLTSQTGCAHHSLMIQSGWDYNTNAYLLPHSIDPEWLVIRDPFTSPYSANTPRPAYVESWTSPGTLNSTSIFGPAQLYVWACDSYSSSCDMNPQVPCGFLQGYRGYNTGPANDNPTVFSYSFCIAPGTNMAAVALTYTFSADDYGKLCINGNTVSVGSTGIIPGTALQAGTNVINVYTYDIYGVITYFIFHGELTTSVPGAMPFQSQHCCNPGNMFITGQKFFDANANGARDLSETGIANWPIVLKDNLGNVITTTVTDTYGNYMFNNLHPGLLNLIPGTYIVSELNQNGFSQTLPSTTAFTLNMSSNAIMANIDFGNAIAPAYFSVPPYCCAAAPISFSAVTSSTPGVVYSWSFGDGSFSTGQNVSHIYNNAGNYSAVLTTSVTGQPASVVTSMQVLQVNTCSPPQACANCVGSFAPDPGDYILNLWVKEDVSPTPSSYSNVAIRVSFTGTSTVYYFGTDPSKNRVIEGWQRIEQAINIPPAATYISIQLINISTGHDAFFDDIRFFPKDGQMKSYVYDPVTLKLEAVLDENNYASFYEYDEEGKLVRIKKETEKGIMTIQENRESLKKR